MFPQLLPEGVEIRLNIIVSSFGFVAHRHVRPEGLQPLQLDVVEKMRHATLHSEPIFSILFDVLQAIEPVSRRQQGERDQKLDNLFGRMMFLRQCSQPILANMLPNSLTEESQ